MAEFFGGMLCGAFLAAVITMTIVDASGYQSKGFEKELVKAGVARWVPEANGRTEFELIRPEVRRGN